MTFWKVKGSNCICKPLVVEPRCFLTDDITISVPVCRLSVNHEPPPPRAHLRFFRRFLAERLPWELSEIPREMTRTVSLLTNPNIFFFFHNFFSAPSLSSNCHSHTVLVHEVKLYMSDHLRSLNITPPWQHLANLWPRYNGLQTTGYNFCHVVYNVAAVFYFLSERSKVSNKLKGFLSYMCILFLKKKLDAKVAYSFEVDQIANVSRRRSRPRCRLLYEAQRHVTLRCQLYRR